ncbi:MAG TPA: TSUP family transporter, partial [Solimonas sp.]|nr:TSUP family transporter [Solimonas sp.]
MELPLEAGIPLLVLCAFAFLAGFVDAVVGGGGLIQVPALFVFLPGLPPATLLGTNKFSSIWGTAAATTQYLRRV